MLFLSHKTEPQNKPTADLEELSLNCERTELCKNK